MNRKQRRAAQKGQRSAGRSPGASWLAEAFAQAARHRELGEWLAAEACCRAILARDPNHAGSLLLLGAIAQHGGRLEEAIAALERALAIKQDNPAAPAPDAAEILLNLGFLHERLSKPEQAISLYRRALESRPEFPEAHNNLGALLLAQGRLKEAAAIFARALALAPELFASFADINALLLKLNPALRDGVQRAAAAWPRIVPLEQLLGPRGIAAIAGDPLLCFILESTAVSDIALEQFLTCARAAVVISAKNTAVESDDDVLALCCALARQCFINEYVFAQTPEEDEQAETLKRALIAKLEDNTAVPALWLAAVASYFPLWSLPDPQSLLERTWPEAVGTLLTQQIREVQQERQSRDLIPRLTAIADGASALVRRQYEENPYPRWVLAASRRAAVTVDEYLQRQFPLAVHRPLDSHDGVDILIAGCGTGEHPINVARRYTGARVLAVDLSLSSLCYAQRKTRELGLRNIDYAQADILRLGSLGRSFDMIDAAGVLHHLADPSEGWRQLLALLRPGGLMCVGLYSELARADVAAARQFIAERGFSPTAADIRRCRQELLNTPLQVLTRYHDFFSISECRDLLFHVQEHRLSIPQIKQFLAARNLRFIGFELNQESQQAYRARFPGDRPMTDLDCWNVFERERPGTFATMYQFWCQKD